MLRAQLLGGTPAQLLGAVTGLTEARFPVHAPSHYSDGFATVPASGDAVRRRAEDARRDDDLLPAGRAGDRGAGRRNRRARRNPLAGALRDPARRLRQHLHLRRARQRGDALPGARAARAHRGQRADRRRRAPPREPAPSGPASAGAQPRSPLSEGATVSGLALGAAATLESPRGRAGDSAGGPDPGRPRHAGEDSAGVPRGRRRGLSAPAERRRAGARRDRPRARRVRHERAPGRRSDASAANRTCSSRSAPPAWARR